MEDDAPKTDKYDRQLRMWGANGQRALNNSRILLIGAGPTGTETLKNLVLPGVGHFTILDDAVVEPRDLGNNFFVEKEHVGKPRAAVTCELLLEMNPDVKGDFDTSKPATLIAQNPGYFSNFSLVIASQLDIRSLEALGRVCWSSNTPLIVCRSYGLIGYLRVQLSDHQVVESKLDKDLQDLRICTPWKELADHCSSIDLPSLDSKVHSHTPFVVILVQAAAAWRDAHEGMLPKTFAEKQAFKSAVKGMARDYEKELNFEEAFENAYKAYALPGVQENVQGLLEDALATPLASDSPSFCILLKALAEFMAPGGEGAGCPPLAGDIPDMTSETDAYVTLQQLYRGKAQIDAQALMARATSLASAAGVPPDNMPTSEEVALFCKHCRSLLRVRTRSLETELTPASGGNTHTAEIVTEVMEDPYEAPQQTPILWYLGLRLVDAFQAKHGRYPGEEDEHYAADKATLIEELPALLSSMGLSEVEHFGANHAKEMARWGAAELHTTAAVVGGLTSQEAVKVLTRQYSPLNNTAIYNGIAGVIGAYEL